MPFRAPPRTGSVDPGAKSNKALLGSRVMRPEVDPYRSLLQSDVYDVGTGRIRGSLSDRTRELRNAESRSRDD